VEEDVIGNLDAEGFQAKLREKSLEVFEHEQMLQLDKRARNALAKIGLEVVPWKIHADRIKGKVAVKWQVVAGSILTVEFDYFVMFLDTAMIEYVWTNKIGNQLTVVAGVFQDAGLPVYIAKHGDGDSGDLIISLDHTGNLKAYLSISIDEYNS
jgi:hypothetical protein